MLVKRPPGSDIITRFCRFHAKKDAQETSDCNVDEPEISNRFTKALIGYGCPRITPVLCFRDGSLYTVCAIQNIIDL